MFDIVCVRARVFACFCVCLRAACGCVRCVCNRGSTASEQLESTQDEDTLQHEWVVSSRADCGVAGLRKGEGTKHPVKEESSPLSDSRRRIDKESVVPSKTGSEVLEDASAGEERWGRDTGAASQGWDCGDMDEMMPSDSASVVRDSEVRALKTALQDMQRRTQPLTAGARSGKSKWEQVLLSTLVWLCLCFWVFLSVSFRPASVLCPSLSAVCSFV